MKSYSYELLQIAVSTRLPHYTHGCVLTHSWWSHQMETSSALLALCAGNSPVTGEFSSQRPVTRRLMFSMIYASINGWAGDLRCHGVHYDITVMLRRRQNGSHFADNIFKYISLNENFWISSGKPLSEPMTVCFTFAYRRHSASIS